jgi:motility quorum-sensing regulator / GCU-specific mRNA interferase toxin
MEKRRPHYDLKLIQAEMDSIETLSMTMSARHDIKAIGMPLGDVLLIIQRLTMRNFYKAMTTHADNRVWQDVYHSQWRGRNLYVKFQQNRIFFVVSFKEQ